MVAPADALRQRPGSAESRPAARTLYAPTQTIWKRRRPTSRVRPGSGFNLGARLPRFACLALFAAVLALAAETSEAGAIATGAGASPPVWEEHGAGQKNGLAVGAYPLPPRRQSGRSIELTADGEAKERWLRRHYEWLRALGQVMQRADRAEGAATQSGRTQGAFAAPAPPGSLRLGDTVVLYADRPLEPAPEHLLDSGGAAEAPESELRNADAIDFMIGERVRRETEAAAPNFVEIAPGAPAAPGARPRSTTAGPLQSSPPFPGVGSASASPAGKAAHPGEGAYTLVGFLRRLAVQVLLAPTTYLLAALTLVAWLIMRAMASSRS